jgi:hypothetical protein
MSRVSWDICGAFDNAREIVGTASPVSSAIVRKVGLPAAAASLDTLFAAGFWRFATISSPFSLKSNQPIRNSNRFK